MSSVKRARFDRVFNQSLKEIPKIPSPIPDKKPEINHIPPSELPPLPPLPQSPEEKPIIMEKEVELPTWDPSAAVTNSTALEEAQPEEEHPLLADKMPPQMPAQEPPQEPPKFHSPMPAPILKNPTPSLNVNPNPNPSGAPKQITMNLPANLMIVEESDLWYIYGLGALTGSAASYVIYKLLDMWFGWSATKEKKRELRAALDAIKEFEKEEGYNPLSGIYNLAH